MRRLLWAIIVVPVALVWASCIPLAKNGDDGQPCFTNGTCLPWLVCRADNVCAKEAETVDGGGDASSSQDTGNDAGTADAGADAGTTDTGNCGPSPSGKGGDMCNVPAGPFQMGCNSVVDTECGNKEYPYHSVSVPAFKIDKREVTASEYRACFDAGGCTAADIGGVCNFNAPGKESHPINCVDWNQAWAYCTWAEKKLPTEAEWEKAARGTDGRRYPWGSTGLDCDHAVDSVTPCSNTGTAPVGGKPAGASPYGAEDMIGNVWEWVEDDDHETFTGAPGDGSAWVDTPRGSKRVMRGGSWSNVDTFFMRASVRHDYIPSGRDGSFGFRCSRDGI